MQWLEAFKECFGHRAQLVSLRCYIQGLLSDSRRKSMSAMLERVTDPRGYQAFQHFITHSPWPTEPVWGTLRRLVPDREGMLVLDGTSFPKQGTHSVGVARQYCGALGKIANCQTAVTAALWTGARAWVLGALMYLPDTWLTPEGRTAGGIPPRIRFQEKWRLAVTLIRQIRAAGFVPTAVLADAEFGDNHWFRAFLHRSRLAYAVGISSTLTVFLERPVLEPPPTGQRRGRPRTRSRLASDTQPVAARRHLAALPARAWRLVSWRNGDGRRWSARFTAVRVTPATEWRDRRLAPEVWLLGEQRGHATPESKYYLVSLPATASLKELVRLAHHRWAIERQYEDLKDELGLDHFEGRTYAGWHHHVVLTALAYNFLQTLRRGRDHKLTFPAVRAIVQEVFTLYLFAQRPHYLRQMDKLRGIELRI
jgi:SRSO17 transposase